MALVSPIFFFVDDLLLFAKTDERNVEAVVEVLDVFCKLSGLKISKEKSIIFFSPNVSMEDKLDIVNLTEIDEIHFFGNYLGFPLIHKGRRRNEFHFVVERVQAKLNGWKSKCLSPAGRLVLIKAVVTAIPKYIMQCHKLPAKVCEEVNKLVRNFLWGSMVDKKKMHLVGWHKVTNPTNMGRLGIFDM